MTPLLDRSSRRPLTGSITVPGDKSISHRALLIAALSGERSRLGGLNDGADVARTRRALVAHGIAVAGNPPGQVEVEGSRLSRWREAGDVVDAGNSGSTARMLAGILAAHAALTVVTGDASLRARPMLRVVAPLRAMGASIDGRAHGDRLPLVIRGGRLRALDHELAIASAQVKTALLLAGMHADGTTSVREPAATRDHTELMLAAAGVPVERGTDTVVMTGRATPSGLEMEVPGDISAAMFFVVAASLLQRSELTISGVGLNRTRTIALDVLARMGAKIERHNTRSSGGEVAGDLHVRAASLAGTEVEPHEVTGAIDEIPALAIAATQADGATTFRGIGELRTKESDRVDAMISGLRAVGATASADADSLVVEGPVPLQGGRVDSRGDHRIAMAFAVAGMISAAPVRVSKWSCVDTSFPGFLDVLGRAQGRKR
ncbi:MAG TPA: 3-phosphoshikimate 1-carboxyvinyltransferase [Actinomycetota bacterium]|nr:3-phosphoshikimate 1-carboxyvinyltransferase [Actinomycetota bacterium]